VSEVPTEAIQPPADDGVDFVPACVERKLIEGRSAILRSTDAGVDVLGGTPSPSFDVTAQLEQLVLGGLFAGADSGVNADATRALPHMDLLNQSNFSHPKTISKPPLDTTKTQAAHPNGVKMCLVVKKLPPDVLKFFKEQGAKGGRIGGKRALETMTPAQRVARAKKASAAAARKRSAKKAK
jgi:hypothetical protein